MMAEPRKKECRADPQCVIVEYKTKSASLKSASKLKIETARKRVDKKTDSATKRMLGLLKE